MKGGVKHVTEPRLAHLTAWSAPQVIRLRLPKYLVAFFFMMNCACACAVILPSTPAPKFEADKTTVLSATLLPPSALSFALALFP